MSLEQTVETINTKSVDLAASIASLERSIDAQLERYADVCRRLRLVERLALSHIDGDSKPHDMHFSEIAGIAGGDPNWLQHARATYANDRKELLSICRSALRDLRRNAQDTELEDAAEYIADLIEQDLLVKMALAGDAERKAAR